MNFRQYSYLNRAYIHAQDPKATYVASYNKWKQLGFQVIEKGCIYVLCPVMKRFYKRLDGQCIPVGKDDADAEAKVASGEYREIQIPVYYRSQPVFDIKKTNATEEDLVRLLAKEQELKETEGITDEYVYNTLSDFYEMDSSKNTYSEKNYEIIKMLIAEKMQEDEELTKSEKSMFVEACTYITLKTLGLKNVIFDYNVMKNHPESPEELVKFHKRLCTCAEKRAQEILVAFL